MNEVGIKVGWKTGSNLAFVFGSSKAGIMSDNGVKWNKTMASPTCVEMV